MTYKEIPLLRGTNEIVRFDSLTPDNVLRAAEISIRNADSVVKDIVEYGGGTFNEILLPLDRVFNIIKRLYFPLDLLVEVHPDSAVREALVKAKQQVKTCQNELFTREELYGSVKKYSVSPDGQSLTGYKKKFLEDILLQFRRSGMELTAEKRNRYKELKAKIEELGTQYSLNSAKVDTFLEISASDTDGLDASYLESRKTGKGTYKIGLDYPSFRPFMRYCKNENLRREIWRLFVNRAYPKNETLLDSVLFFRDELAKLLGYNSYAEYSFAANMAGTTIAVWEFENSLREMVYPKGELDVKKLSEIKSAFGKNSELLQEWEISFFENILKEKEYNLDDRILREYFELNSVINGLFRITQKLLGLRYEEIINPKVWHPEVRVFNCFDVATGKLKGRFYLDLFPRKDKYSHAAMFTITPGRKMENNDWEIPEAALVCNFSKPEGDKPSLLYHGEVETFFHEFGHLLHGIASTAELAYQSGPEACMLDFVEAPSQIWENWSYHKESLDLFAKHYKTGEPIPAGLVQKLISQKHLNSGIDALRQIYYGTFALTLHDKYVPYASESIIAISHRLRREITGFTPLPDDHFECSFGHLIGYDAGYYSYMWSKVYAQDMWSVFEEKGPLNPATGELYREKILAPGGSAHPLELVKTFLGRKPDNKALLKELGLEVE